MVFFEWAHVDKNRIVIYFEYILLVVFFVYSPYGKIYKNQ